MSIVQEFTRINNAKIAIAESIRAKGVHVNNEDPIEYMSSKIDEINTDKVVVAKNGQWSFIGLPITKLPNLDMSLVTDLHSKFRDTSLSGDIIANTGLLTTARFAFYGCNASSIEIPFMSDRIDMYGICAACKNLLIFTGPPVIKPSDLITSFHTCENLEEIRSIIDMSLMGPGKFDRNSFGTCKNLKTLMLKDIFENMDMRHYGESLSRESLNYMLSNVRSVPGKTFIFRKSQQPMIEQASIDSATSKGWIVSFI